MRLSKSFRHNIAVLLDNLDSTLHIHERYRRALPLMPIIELLIINLLLSLFVSK